MASTRGKNLYYVSGTYSGYVVARTSKEAEDHFEDIVHDAVFPDWVDAQKQGDKDLEHLLRIKTKDDNIPWGDYFDDDQPDMLVAEVAATILKNKKDQEEEEEFRKKQMLLIDGVDPKPISEPIDEEEP